MARGNVHLKGTIDIPSARLAAANELLQAHIKVTRAEPGCLFFSVSQSKDQPGCFEVVECFSDQAAFDFHQTRTKASAWGDFTRDFARQYQTRVEK